MPATSEYFRVSLGVMDEDTKQRVAEWARRNLVATELVCTSDGVELFGQRPGAKNSKAFKMMFRTLFQHWAIALQINRSDWLELLTEVEFHKAMAAVGVDVSPQNSEQSAETIETVEEPFVRPKLRQPTLPSQHHCMQVEFRTHLSANFDQESIRLLQDLRTRGQIGVECAA